MLYLLLNIFSAITLLVIGGYIIKVSGIASFEGVGVLLYIFILIPSSLYSAFYHDIRYNIDVSYSNFIHSVGLASLMLGVLTIKFIINQKAKPSLNRVDIRRVNVLGLPLVMILVGSVTSVSGYLLAGYSLVDIVFASTSEYVTEKSIFGGWFDKGLLLFDVGVMILLLNIRSLMIKILLLSSLIIFHFLLSHSRGGLIGFLLMFLVAYLYFNKRNLKQLVWLFIILTVSSVLLGGLSALSRLGMNDAGNESSKIGVVEIFLSRLSDRFGDEGLADGYSNIISRLDSSEHPFANGDVMIYSIVSNVPSFIYPNKPMHPFRATGDLVYRDRPPVNFEDVSAFGLIAGSYYDFGLASVVAYLYIFGLILAICRYFFYIFDPSGLLYFIFIFMDGASNFIHGGVTNLLGGILLSIFFYYFSVFIYHIFYSVKKLTIEACRVVAA